MLSWKEYFESLTILASKKSKDESTQCGAIIVSPTKEILSTGYNGLPRGLSYSKSRQERPLKYSYFEHAERNAIYNAARNGIKLLGTELWVTGVPCTDCARAIIQAGIRKVHILTDVGHDMSFYERWKDQMIISLGMFTEAGVEKHWVGEKKEEIFEILDK